MFLLFNLRPVRPQVQARACTPSLSQNRFMGERLSVHWSTRLVVVVFGIVLLAGGCGPEIVTSSPTQEEVDDRFATSVQRIGPGDPAPEWVAREEPAPAQPAATPREDPSPDEPRIDDAFRMAGKMPMVWRVTEWANSEPLRWSDLRGKVVFVRFFKLESAACHRTMPAMQQLCEEFRDRPVLFIGLYHSGSDDRGPEWDTVVDQIRAWGVKFPIARDEGRVTLSRWWLDYFNHVPDTPSFVIGPDGRIVYVHPGPEFHPSDDLMFALCEQDYRTIRLAIQTALPQDVAQRTKVGRQGTIDEELP
jgi:peroxiredoxin